MKKTCSILAAALGAGLMSLGAHAAAPTFAGSFGSGTTAGTVAAESLGSSGNWTFWTFTADFLSDVSITITPTSSDLDVIFGVWFGVETDTENYSGINTDSLSTLLVGYADGTEFNPTAGAGQAASLRFFNDYGTGPFVLAIADYTDGVGSGQLGYTITASVPEPETYALLLAGLGLIGVAARRRA
ncbi:FxDxF family PEP-CTERM protein [Methyloversatilis thermotolerans]|uniref:FxDxF family PEP-CTERM protein n=1 Tax=Methyloversatilis thermotolerans TaxID=1346290 RepID=UPI00037EE9F7|nr:FxDxF family PEP-CTERM protein [Methyloversatilis thermotolerans]